MIVHWIVVLGSALMASDWLGGNGLYAMASHSTVAGFDQRINESHVVVIGDGPKRVVMHKNGRITYQGVKTDGEALRLLMEVLEDSANNQAAFIRQANGYRRSGRPLRKMQEQRSFCAVGRVPEAHEYRGAKP